jgi:hypothetical protein
MGFVAVVVLVGFVASIAAFAISIFGRHRYGQILGAVWAVIGLVFYVVTFGDRFWLPGLHHPLGILPTADTSFSSPAAVIWVLLVLYVLRGLAFSAIFDPLLPAGLGDADDLNDEVAPLLSYIGMAFVVDTAFAEAYGLSWGWIAVCVLTTAAAYLLPMVVRRFLPQIAVAVEFAVSIATTWLIVLRHRVFVVILQLYRFARWSKGVPATPIEARIHTIREATNRRAAQERQRRAELLAKALGKSETRLRAAGSRRWGFGNPNER